jgi:hypothetical protein
MLDALALFMQIGCAALLLWGAVVSLAYCRVENCRRHMFDEAGPVMSAHADDFSGLGERPLWRIINGGRAIAAAPPLQAEPAALATDAKIAA